ncbi:MFS transporter [Gryllotalpicola protaetiae]|uniref:MFS transporter n=1 Tax=Gryllotalpicola protaetiae TaxID=2419771 RepID=A0A387BEV2_9MICO|nr:MFS transporter [Gryllotalpicola protaetiae]AYG02433.1 MFS transporter [Gryllotalpicola protaetiae]
MTQTARAEASAAPSPARADDEPLPRRGLVFAIVSIGLFMVSVDGTVVATALSSLQRELHAGVQWGAWTITIYSLGQVLVMPLAGKISDMYGRKRVFLAAVVLFTATSLLCGLAQNIQMLVALRAVQALGGGSIMPAASGIVSDHFGRNRDRALGMFTSIFPIGGVVGPILGGIFVTYWSWRGIFLVNVPIGIALVLLGAAFFPATQGHRGGRLDFVGTLTMAATILSAMIGIAVLGDGVAWHSPGVLVPEALAVVFGWLFVRHTRRAPAPFISLHLLVGRGFGVMNVINFLYGAAAIGFGALVPLYAQERFGISALASGTLLTARAVGMICIAGIAVFALRRTGYRLPMIVGFLLVSGGLVMMFLPPAGLSAYVWLSISAAITGLGMGLAVPAANNATLQFAKGQIAGVSGLRGMFRQAGSIIAVSVVTAVIAQASDPGMSLGVSFLVLAATLVAIVPAVFLVPEHRGSW